MEEENEPSRDSAESMEEEPSRDSAKTMDQEELEFSQFSNISDEKCHSLSIKTQFLECQMTDTIFGLGDTKLFNTRVLIFLVN